MQNEVIVKIFLRGPFRQYSDNDFIEFTVAQGASLSEIKSAMIAELRKQHSDFDADKLLSQSVFADADQILQDDFCLQKKTELTIIPPVCGG